jgi:hypothetical protein
MLVDQIKSENRTSKVVDNSHGLSMRQKHQDLLSVTRKLVIPAKYRALTEMSNHIDTCLNFLKSRRDKADFILFREVAQSIA